MEKRNVRVDDVVIVQDPNANPNGQSHQCIQRKGCQGMQCKNENTPTKNQRPITKIVVIYVAEGYKDLSFEDEDTALIRAESVQIVNELCEEFSLAAGKSKTAQA